MSQNNTTTQAAYVQPSVTSYTEVELFSLMEAWGVSGGLREIA